MAGISIHAGPDGPTDKVALTADGVVKGATGFYWGWMVTVVTATAAITIYDNASAAAGTVLDVIPTGTAAGASGVLPQPIPCANGIYCDFGPSATGTVLFLYS